MIWTIAKKAIIKIVFPIIDMIFWITVITAFELLVWYSYIKFIPWSYKPFLYKIFKIVDITKAITAVVMHAGELHVISLFIQKEYDIFYNFKIY
jgi:hypothetical protein